MQAGGNSGLWDMLHEAPLVGAEFDPRGGASLQAAETKWRLDRPSAAF
jgi:hypothetical protein